METFSKKVNGLNTLFIKSKCNNCFIEKDIKKSNYTTSIKKQGYYLCVKCALEKRNKNNTHFKGTPIHNSYAAAKQRCNYKKGLFYHRYGGRGISIEWKNFNDFYNDMNSTWFEGATLERINLDGNYCKDNCVWATRTEQARNTSRNIHNKEKISLIRDLYIQGKYNQKELSEIFNDSAGNISNIIAGKTWKE